MKILGKLTLSIGITFMISLVGGYCYFENKFTPPENDLEVSGFTNDVSIRWDSTNDNPYSAILLPVQLEGIHKTFYMQLDSGSPSTLFYKNSLESIQEKFQNHRILDHKNNHTSISFNIGNMKVTSDHFNVLDYGHTIDSNAENVIGTIGTDLLQKRIISLDFKNNLCSFIDRIREDQWVAFEFKKRKIIISASIGNEKLKLLYDSGTSGYELITDHKNWGKYRNKAGRVKKEKGNSWGNTITAISAPADQKIKFGNKELKLSEVTYVEGTSKMQNLLMAASGMQGMIGNKIFLNYKLTLDCKNRKFLLE